METFRLLIGSHRLKLAGTAFLYLLPTAVVCAADVALTRITGAVSEAALARNMALIWNLLLLMAGVTAAKLVSGVTATAAIRRFGARVQYAFRERLAGRLTAVGFRELAQKSSGDLLSVYSNDLPLAAGLLATDLPQLMSEFLALLFSAALMVVIHPWYTLLFFAMFPPLTLLQARMAAPIGPLVADAQEKRGVYNATVLDSLQNTAVVAAYGLEDVMERRWEQQYRAYFAAQMRRISVFGRLIIGGLLATFLPLFFLFLAAALSVVSGRMAVGDFVALTALALTALSFLSMLSQRLNSVEIDLAGARRLLGAAPPSVGSGEDDCAEAEAPPFRLDGSAPAFAFQDVSFAYEPDGTPTLVGVDLAIEAGSRVAIVGGSGSGKSTLLKLMLSLYTPDQGELRVFGVDVRQAKRKELRDLIAYVPQDSFLFPGTIRENLTCVREADRQDEAALLQACRDAGILGFLESLPGGLDTVLAEGADNFSGGQRQRLAVARALYKDAPILLFDEATSGLDPATEQALLEALYTAAHGRTVIAVAHRQAAIAACDRVLVMENGRICGEVTA